VAAGLITQLAHVDLEQPNRARGERVKPADAAASANVRASGSRASTARCSAVDASGAPRSFNDSVRPTSDFSLQTSDFELQTFTFYIPIAST
jgi:hypothetical protein